MKVTNTPKAIWIFSAIPRKIPTLLFTTVEENYPKIHMEPQKIPDSHKVVNKKSNDIRITIPALKIYYRAMVIKTIQNWPRNRHADQRKKTQDPNRKKHNFGHLIFDKKAKNVHWRKDSIFNSVGKTECGHTSLMKGLGKLKVYMQKTKLDPHLSPCTKTDSKWNKGLNLRHRNY